ncbi:MAG: ABC transporter ATP-binding protein [Actinomycetota bacterium]
MASLAVRDVAVSYNGTRAVQGLSFSAPAGSWLGLVGPNGAGKTTVLRSIAGLVGFEGAISLDGAEVSESARRDLARSIAFVPQRPVIPGGTTVAEYVMLGRTPHISYLGSERAPDRRAVAQVMERLELASFASRPLGSLSGGETQRAVLARALAQEAPLLLLDEPTSALDVGRAQGVLELIDDLRKEEGLTVVSAMHDLTLAGHFPEDLLMLDRGRAVATGKAREVLTPQTIQRYYGARVKVLEEPGGGIAVVPTRDGTS